ncbi:MAG: glycosyl transferase group 1 [Solirubrobacteraceae bacterium]|nr:glycosyl transferase group 1 [Solirubrobacteraceae bacterium]
MTRPLRVHALIDTLGAGGAELLLAELAVAAPAAGIDLSVGYLSDRDGSPAAQRLRGVGVEPQLVGIGRMGVAEARAVHAHVRAAAPDVLHCHFDASDILGGIAARRLGIPAVSTLHGMHWVGADRRAALRLYLGGQARRRLMRRVIAVSDAARTAYMERGWSPAGQLTVIPNGIAGHASPGAGRAVRTELGLDHEDFVVGIVAALRPEKNHTVAVGAVRRLRETVPGARLLVVGDGPARDEVRAQVGRLGTAGVMTGHRDDVMAVLDAIDVLVHTPSFDALPTALMEAMAAGVPVVATRVGGIPEIVEEGVTGTLVAMPPEPGPVGEALAALARDPALRAAMGAAARRRFESHFDVNAWAGSLRSLYDEVLT